MAILKYAGRDATAVFEPYHPSDTLQKYMKPDQNIGLLSEPASPVEHVTSRENQKPVVSDVVSKQITVKLRSIINIMDFELAASQNLPPRSYACKFEILFLGKT